MLDGKAHAAPQPSHYHQIGLALLVPDAYKKYSLPCYCPLLRKPMALLTDHTTFSWQIHVACRGRQCPGNDNLKHWGEKPIHQKRHLG